MDFDQTIINSIITASAANQEYKQRNGFTNSIKPNELFPIVTNPSQSKGWGFSSSLPKPSSSLTQAVSSLIGKEIKVFQFDADTAPNIDGMCTEYETYAEIFLNKGLNFCWQRFIYAKEMSHLLLNKNDDEFRSIETVDVHNNIDKLILGIEPQTKVEASELTAYIGATELLFPRHIYEATRSMTNTEIAKKIRCPVRVIEFRRDTKSVIDWFERAYNDPRMANSIINERVKRANR